MRYCPDCGTERRPSDAYCRECGRELDGGTAGASGSESGAASGRAGPVTGDLGPVTGSGDRTPGTAGAAGTGDRADASARQSTGERTGEWSSGDAGGSNGQGDRTVGGDGDGGFLTRRRALLGGGAVVGGIALLALLDEPDHRVDGEAWDVEREESFGAVSITGTLELPAGRYAARNLDPEVGVTYDLSLSVTDGGSVDVLVLEDDEYDRYRDRDDDFQVLSELSESEVTDVELSGDLSAGEYTFVVDNTAVFGADPDGEVVAEIDLQASL